ncbi:hypothetical protein P353_17680 [Comamonas testosteroni]|uniref:Uncharacterized protein n=1 Tax=Comamonas testosteroni TaxID=285 RepID=A0A096FBY9_COMTE|nr:hypothetical protein P353_17680 [Comamonas testosteroni]
MAALVAASTAAACITGLQCNIFNAQLGSDAAACRDLVDQHQRLAALAAEDSALSWRAW